MNNPHQPRVSPTGVIPIIRRQRRPHIDIGPAPVAQPASATTPKAAAAQQAGVSTPNPAQRPAFVDMPEHRSIQAALNADIKHRKSQEQAELDDLVGVQREPDPAPTVLPIAIPVITKPPFPTATQEEPKHETAAEPTPDAAEPKHKPAARGKSGATAVSEPSSAAPQPQEAQ